MKLELNNNTNNFSIEKLIKTTYFCDLCPDFITSQAVAMLCYDHSWISQGEVFSECVEIKFCQNCKEIIAEVFNNLD